jgi:hypothetical protein
MVYADGSKSGRDEHQNGCGCAVIILIAPQRVYSLCLLAPRSCRLPLRFLLPFRVGLSMQSLYDVATTCLCVATLVAVFNVTLAASAAGKSRSTFVDPAFSLNEGGKRFDVGLVLHRVPQHARPLGSRSFVHLLSISGRENDGCEWFVGIWCVHTLQLQRPTSTADRTTFCRPPLHKVKHGAEVAIDRVAIPAGLAFVPSVLHPKQILPQRFSRVGNVVLNRLSQARRRQPKMKAFLRDLSLFISAYWTEFQPGRPSHYEKSSSSS